VALLKDGVRRDAGKMKIRREPIGRMSPIEEMWSRIDDLVAPLFDYWPELMLHPVAPSSEASLESAVAVGGAFYDSSILGSSGVCS
jgi:hypothetical protein